jgi:hypothetical protein
MYNEYPRKHRNVSKADSTTLETTIVDSGATAGGVFKLQDGDETDDGKFANKAGNVEWLRNKPEMINTPTRAMVLCLEQLVDKGRVLIILHRNPEGGFRAYTWFSGAHRAFRLINNTGEGQATIEQLIFGMGGKSDETVECQQRLMGHLNSLSTPAGAIRAQLCKEMTAIFHQATSLWGNPRRTIPEQVATEKINIYHFWPEPRFEECSGDGVVGNVGIGCDLAA